MNDGSLPPLDLAVLIKGDKRKLLQRLLLAMALSPVRGSALALKRPAVLQRRSIPRTR